MSLSSEIWERRASRSGDEISVNKYAFVVSTLVVVGILVSLASSFISRDWQLTNGWLVLGLFVGVFVCGILGSVVATSSESPVTSFLGYMMIAVPFGILLGPVLAIYTTASVVTILTLTTVIVAVFGFIGAIIPRSLHGWGSYLMMALVGLIVGYVFIWIARALGYETTFAVTLIDIIGVIIFCALVVYDWNKAMHLPKTMDNAVDSAVAIYLDWFNIFIRLLSLLGKKN